MGVQQRFSSLQISFSLLSSRVPMDMRLHPPSLFKQQGFIIEVPTCRVELPIDLEDLLDALQDSGPFSNMCSPSGSLKFPSDRGGCLTVAICPPWLLGDAFSGTSPSHPVPSPTPPPIGCSVISRLPCLAECLRGPPFKTECAVTPRSLVSHAHLLL